MGGALSRRDTTARQQGDTHHAPALLYSSVTVAQVSKHVSVFRTAHSFPPVEMGRHEVDASHLLSAQQVGAASVTQAQTGTQFLVRHATHHAHSSVRVAAPVSANNVALALAQDIQSVPRAVH